jgi:hypothetical protein
METTKASAPANEFKYIISWGLLMAVAGIVYSLILYYSGQMFNMPLVYSSSLILGIITFIAVKRFRDNRLGGYISFQKAFTIGFMAIVFAGVIEVTFSQLVFLKYIAPDAREKALIHSKQQMIEQGKLTEEQIDATMKVSKTIQNPVLLAIIGILTSAFMGAIISLIVAAICKKEDTGPVVSG